VPALPAQVRRQTTDADGIVTRSAHVAARHKTVAQPLHRVVLVKTNQHT